MPSLIQSAFVGGEWAPEYAGRTDLKGYAEAVATSRNMLILPQGGATRRQGFLRVAGSKFGTGARCKVRSFSPAAGVWFVVEIGHEYIRFYRGRAPVLSGGAVYEIPTLYTEGDLDDLSLAAVGPELYITHAAHHPQVLLYQSSDTGWTLQVVETVDGPYLDPVTSGTVLTPTVAGLTPTLAASRADDINSGAGFVASDVGRWLRLQMPAYQLTEASSINTEGSQYQVGDLFVVAGGVYLRPASVTVTSVSGTTGIGGIAGVQIADAGQYLVPPGGGNVNSQSTTGMGSGGSVDAVFAQVMDETQDQQLVWVPSVITAVIDSLTVTADCRDVVYDAEGHAVAGRVVSTVPITTWRLGAWCDAEGWPEIAGGLFQQRLVFGATRARPRRLFLTESPAPGRMERRSMAPSLGTGQVIASNAIAFDLSVEAAGRIRWISGAGNAQLPQLGVGTDTAEFSVRSAALALSPTDIQDYLETHYSSPPGLAPLRIGRHLLFVDGSRCRLREWSYAWGNGGFVGPEIQPFGWHLTRHGLSEIAYSLTPYPMIWGVNGDGLLVAMTYLPQEEGIAVAAWHSHAPGGSWYGATSIVSSLCVSASEESVPYDEVWIVVDRADGNLTQRTIEVLSPPFRGRPIDQAIFVDSAKQSPLTYPAATCTASLQEVFNPSRSRLLPAAGDNVIFSFSAGIASSGDVDAGTILRLNSGAFWVKTVSSATVIITTCLIAPKSLAPQPSAAWSYTRLQREFAGFDAYEGALVQVLGDGSVYPAQRVVGGKVVLPADQPASQVTIGYGAPAWIETLDLDLPALDGTSQMKTGRLDHLYLRVFETAGGFYGPDLDHLDPIDSRDSEALTDWPPPLISDDLRVATPSGSSSHRRVVVRQDDPLPLSVLGVVVRGGTGELSPR